MTIIPPDPIIEPAFQSSSKSTGVSSMLSGRTPPEGPPVCTALIRLPSGMPPPMSYTISLNVVPIGTSTNPVFRIFPTRENILVPLLFSVPMPRNQSAPWLIINGTFAHVSTLFRQVGFSHSPFSDV